MRIIGFSPETFQGVRKFFKEHPVIQIQVIREANLASDCVTLLGGKCAKCGWEWTPDKIFLEALSTNLQSIGEEMPIGSLPVDFFKSIKVIHAWDQKSRSQYCGGRLNLQVESPTAKAV